MTTGTSLPERLATGGLATSGSLVAKAFRFVLVGVLSGTIYASVTAALVAGMDVAPVAASIVGYCVSVPASFLGHRQFSFRSNGRWSSDAVRFVVAQALNISVTAGAMYAATDYFRLHYYWGMVAAVILVPIANFIFMNIWVFRYQAGRRDR